MAGFTFGEFQVLAKLATGGSAGIYLARQAGAAGLRSLVCLKVLLPSRAHDPDFVAMFLDEARLAAQLHHPNCVQVHDLNRVDDVFYIVMEYIFGETLWDLLASVARTQRALPPSPVALALAGVCDGLHHAHELRDAAGVPYDLVHRDLSPQNIMITYTGVAKVLDFGVAKAKTGRADTQVGVIKGKFSYMSPEQIAGVPLDRRSDVYALGIVLFECLASRRLYRADSPEAIARLILDHRAPRLSQVVSEVAPELDRIVAKALARRPDHRFQTAQDLAEALREYLESSGESLRASALVQMLGERFPDRIEARHRILEGLKAGHDDEQELLKAFDAYPVHPGDFAALYPSGLGPSSSSSWSSRSRQTGPVDPAEWSLEAMLDAEVHSAASTEALLGPASPGEFKTEAPALALPGAEIQALEGRFGGAPRSTLEPREFAGDGRHPEDSGVHGGLPWLEPLVQDVDNDPTRIEPMGLEFGSGGPAHASEASDGTGPGPQLELLGGDRSTLQPVEQPPASWGVQDPGHDVRKAPAVVDHPSPSREVSRVALAPEGGLRLGVLVAAFSLGLSLGVVLGYGLGRLYP